MMKLTYGNVTIEVRDGADPEEYREAYEAFGRLCEFLVERKPDIAQRFVEGNYPYLYDLLPGIP